MPTTPSKNSLPRRQAVAVLSTLMLALVAACGGGGDDSAGSPTATSYSQGTISGFGSVIVNGVRWDDSGASVSDDDGNRRSSDDLKLGMVVEVDGASVDRSSSTGRALAIRYGSELKGPVGSVDAAAGTLVVLGQAVQVTATTVFEAGISGGLAGIAPGAVVEVHGLYDAASGRTVATRIELETGASDYRLRGAISALDTGAKTFRIGSELISYATAGDLPRTLADGQQVKVRLQTTQVAGAWVATRVRALQRAFDDRAETEVEGVITAWTSATAFEINGLQVDATNAVFREGQAGVVLGARVEVEGAVVNGVLVARKVHLEDDDDDGDDSNGPDRLFELHGTISGLDTTARTFVLRGLTVSYAGSVAYDDGSEARLANNLRVEVKGVLAADLTSIAATEIDFE
ncbi:DUF5666 domain-containing protein [Rubrivivax sp. RP6-9]|uniref:DUF5666 domain-containing protein n=1 Tax=Rubrivivax sp. RP6-9 TaxID=3415750 RepID=UPI003CC53B5B